MRAGLIPDGEIPARAKRIVMAPPDGDLTNTDIVLVTYWVVMFASSTMRTTPAELSARVEPSVENCHRVQHVECG